MKNIALLSLAFLTACSQTSQWLQGPSMLSVAPKNSQEVMYPEWGEAPVSHSQSTQKTVVSVSTQMTEYSSTTNGQASPHLGSLNHAELESALQQMGITYQVQPGNTLVIHLPKLLQFKTDSATIAPTAKEKLDRLGNYLAPRKNITIVIGGNADDRGSYTYNNTLSELRAGQVEKRLLLSNIEPTRVFTKGYGEFLPLCPAKTAEARACNRRVDLWLILDK
ncbi:MULTISPECIES: OmpA family protein [unclassified Vibrio]|uniref:OmpA family protein n=1 Tax=Vibrio sp. HB236076 TaxID=3232307 RepID=A0AB39HID1_9VIBR|nr:OmpA family protein [Vibrio sp. HB161653]MDP5253210.1 OmpA family protein [Vibrio sp. HB161653]